MQNIDKKTNEISKVMDWWIQARKPPQGIWKQHEQIN